MRAAVGVSNRHIHLSREDADVLFGKDYAFSQLKPLLQPGQFACEETVTVKGPKGTINKVRVLGPLRPQTQLEVSKTDSFVLGVDAPIRDSGDVEGSPGIEVVGPNGTLLLDKGVIIASRHLHLHLDDATQLGVKDKDSVAVKTTGTRMLILENVLCRVSPQYTLEFHVDTDEANASGLRSGDEVQIVAVDSYRELRTYKKKTMLLLNCGSSSIKFKLIEMPSEKLLMQGNQTRDSMHTLQQSLTDIFERVGPDVDVIAHRVVHGADLFDRSVLVTDEVMRQIESISYLAPLHNPINLEGIRLAGQHYKGTPQVVVFDTSFHQTMPPTSYLYSIPYEYYEKHKIRKYGFHGTSHRYVVGRAAEIMGKPPENLRLISCHIGNGVSVTAVRNGQSYDTSMGLTPLAGVMMGTRSGNIDPAVIPYLERLEGLQADEVINVLNHRSGLLGISGVSNDLRDLLKLAKEGHERSKLALDLFVSKLHQYIGLYFARLNGADGIIFTAGVGENSAQIREMICQGLEFAGVYLDAEANWNGSGERLISSKYSPIKVMVIPTDEEIVMARDAYQIVDMRQ